MDRGRRLVKAEAPEPEKVPVAAERFREVLRLDPGHREAAWERQLAELYLDGYAACQEANWHKAVASLGAVDDQRANYLGDITLGLLYDALINSGDRYAEEGDRLRACEQYRRAAGLPVENNAWALHRILGRCGCPPTRTPTATFTPSLHPPLPTPVRPTATPNPGRMHGLVVNAYYIPRAPGPLGQGRDIWFSFSVTNTTNETISYIALGTWVQETGQFQKSWTYSQVGPGYTLIDRDHVNIIQPGTYDLWLGIHYSDGSQELLSGPIRVVVE
jgi:hypothetical protein